MIGLLLMVRINYQHRLIMNRRRIPCLDGYLDRVNLVLWPRFKVRALLDHARLRPALKPRIRQWRAVAAASARACRWRGCRETHSVSAATQLQAVHAALGMTTITPTSVGRWCSTRSWQASRASGLRAARSRGSRCCR